MSQTCKSTVGCWISREKTSYPGSNGRKQPWLPVRCESVTCCRKMVKVGKVAKKAKDPRGSPRELQNPKPVETRPVNKIQYSNQHGKRHCQSKSCCWLAPCTFQKSPYWYYCCLLFKPEVRRCLVLWARVRKVKGQVYNIYVLWRILADHGLLWQGGADKTKKSILKFTVDCQQPSDDNIIETKDFEQFLMKKIKVDGKAGNLGDKISINREKAKIHVTAESPFSKRYLKYLGKKYLKSQQFLWLTMMFRPENFRESKKRISKPPCAVAHPSTFLFIPHLKVMQPMKAFKSHIWLKKRYGMFLSFGDLIKMPCPFCARHFARGCVTSCASWPPTRPPTRCDTSTSTTTRTRRSEVISLEPVLRRKSARLISPVPFGKTTWLISFCSIASMRLVVLACCTCKCSKPKNGGLSSSHVWNL